MVRKRLYLYRCPSCLGETEALNLTRLGGKDRQPFRARDGVDVPAVDVRVVLCWWCRMMHPPDEVSACMALPERKATANGNSSSSSSVLEKGLLSAFSEIWEFLTATSYPDGRKRRTGRLSVTYESGLLGLLLTDEETGQYAFLNGRNLDDLLLEAETRLGDGSLAWRLSRYPGKRK